MTHRPRPRPANLLVMPWRTTGPTGTTPHVTAPTQAKQTMATLCGVAMPTRHYPPHTLPWQTAKDESRATGIQAPRPATMVGRRCFHSLTVRLYGCTPKLGLSPLVPSTTTGLQQNVTQQWQQEDPCANRTGSPPQVLPAASSAGRCPIKAAAGMHACMHGVLSGAHTQHGVTDYGWADCDQVSLVPHTTLVMHVTLVAGLLHPPFPQSCCTQTATWFCVHSSSHLPLAA
jgi:hypothetical protein